jgi:hypothetical protein
VSAEAISRAVELATIVASAKQLDEQLVVDAIVERLAHLPVRSLAAQAALCGVVGELAEARVGALLRDPELLAFCSQMAQAGRPVLPSALGVTPSLLLREAGISAARLDG